jgi:hypothetical protein
MPSHSRINTHICLTIRLPQICLLLQHRHPPRLSSTLRPTTTLHHFLIAEQGIRTLRSTRTILTWNVRRTSIIRITTSQNEEGQAQRIIWVLSPLWKGYKVIRTRDHLVGMPRRSLGIHRPIPEMRRRVTGREDEVQVLEGVHLVHRQGPDGRV